jgi:hypothetical protein
VQSGTRQTLDVSAATCRAGDDYHHRRCAHVRDGIERTDSADAGGDIGDRGDDHGLEVIAWATWWGLCQDAIAHLLVGRGAKHHILSAVTMNRADEVRRIVGDDRSALKRRMKTELTPENGAHGYNPACFCFTTYNVYERLLGMDQTPWIQRGLDIRLKAKEANARARKKAGEDRVQHTSPSHALTDYVGEYENPAYGLLKIGLKEKQLLFDFHKMTMAMTHFHYDRFDTPDDEENGKWSVNFKTNPQGDIEQAVMSLDEAEAVFTRKPETLDPQLITQLAGSYETPTGTKIQVTYQESRGLSIVPPGAPPLRLNQVKGLRFRTPQFSDVVFEFVVENGRVTALKQRNPSGEFSFPKR